MKQRRELSPIEGLKHIRFSQEQVQFRSESQVVLGHSEQTLLAFLAAKDQLIADLRCKIDSLLQKLVVSNQAHIRLKESFRQSKSQTIKRTSGQASGHEEVELAAQELAFNRSRIVELQQAIQTRHTHIASIHQEYQNLRVSHIELGQRMQKVMAQARELALANGELAASNRQLGLKNGELAQQVQSLKQESAVLRKKLSAMEQSNLNFRNSVTVQVQKQHAEQLLSLRNQLLAARSRQLESVEILRQREAEFQTFAEASRVHRASYQQECQQLLARVNLLERELQQSQRGRLEASEQCIRLERQVKEREAEQLRLKEKNESLQSQLNVKKFQRLTQEKEGRLKGRPEEKELSVSTAAH